MKLLFLASLLLGPELKAAEPDGVQVVITTAAAESGSMKSDPNFAYSPAARALIAVIDSLGYPHHFQVMPFARANLECEKQGNAVIAPLARTPKREAAYRWLIPLYEADVVLVSRATPLTEQGASKPVGLVRGSVAEEVAQTLGIHHVEMTADSVQNAKKLAHDRISSWLVLRSQAYEAFRFAGLDPKQFRFSKPLTKVPVYIAACSDFDQNEARRWTEAGQALQASGQLDAIFAGMTAASPVGRVSFAKDPGGAGGVSGFR